MTPPAVAIEMPGRGQKLLSQKPYKYGMAMLCLGALINWLGLAENYVEPIRFIGIACIITGAMLICAAMCCWMNTNAVTPPQTPDTTDIHVIEISQSDRSTMKPPDYESVAMAPPSYDVAIKLNPVHLLLEDQLQQTRVENSPPPYTVTVQSATS